MSSDARWVLSDTWWVLCDTYHSYDALPGFAILEEENYYKTWEDVLDVIAKLRFGSKGRVTVLDMGTLRRQYIERNNGEFS